MNESLAALTAAVVYQTSLLHLIEHRLSMGSPPPNHRPRRRRFVGPFVIALVAGLLILLSGCSSLPPGGELVITRSNVVVTVVIPFPTNSPPATNSSLLH